MKRRVNRHAVQQPPDESYRLIPLTQGQNAIVDVSDFDWLSQWYWHAWWNPCTKSFYALRKDQGNVIRMSRAILGCASDKQCDHRNHNTLDNRRANLRECTRTENCRNRKVRSDNSSGYVGVIWKEKLRKWQARVYVNGKYISLGCYTSKKDAAKARIDAAKTHYGEFLPLPK